AIGVGRPGCEFVLEAEEVKEIQAARAVAVRVARRAARADRQPAGRLAAHIAEAAADPHIAIDHLAPEDAAISAAADRLPRAAGELEGSIAGGLANVERRARPVIKDGAGGDAPADLRPDRLPRI